MDTITSIQFKSFKIEAFHPRVKFDYVGLEYNKIIIDERSEQKARTSKLARNIITRNKKNK